MAIAENQLFRILAVILQIPSTKHKSLDHAIFSAQRRDIAIRMLAEHRANNPDAEADVIVDEAIHDADVFLERIRESRNDESESQR